MTDRKVQERNFECKSQTGLAKSDTTADVTVNFLQGANKAAKVFVETYHPGYELLGALTYWSPRLWRGEAVNRETQMGLIVWVKAMP